MLVPRPTLPVIDTLIVTRMYKFDLNVSRDNIDNFTPVFVAKPPALISWHYRTTFLGVALGSLPRLYLLYCNLARLDAFARKSNRVSQANHQSRPRQRLL